MDAEALREWQRYPSVRLTVVHALSTTDPTIAKPLLRAFTNDPDPTVAGEAKRYLAAM